VQFLGGGGAAAAKGGKGPAIAAMPSVGKGFPGKGCNPADLMYAPSFVGVVKSYSPKSGWGMIECEMTFNLYGKDVFFSKSVAPPQGLAAGEQVRFSVKMEEKGPAALEVTPLTMYVPTVPMAWPQAPGFGSGFGSPPMAAPVYGGTKGALPSNGLKASKDPTYYGHVKAFYEEKGWGHISCEATMKLYGKDVFLMRGKVTSDIAIVTGSLVSFKVTPSAKGPQATEIHVLPEGAVGVNGLAGKSYSGVIKSFNSEKGWGFVAGDEIQEVFGKDIFINKRELQGVIPDVGEEVNFTVEVDNDGQAQAKNVSIGSAKRMKLR
jgi:cold shock CspA family protein